MNKWTTVEEHYEKAVGQHNDWKTAKVNEAQVEKLRQDKKACLLKVEALKQEKLEAERKAEEKRQEDKQLWLEAKVQELEHV